MKRTNYLFATFLAAIVLAGQLALNVWTTTVMLRVFLGSAFPVEAIYVLALQGLVDAVILVAFILTLVGTKYIGKDKETFKKGTALIVTNVIFIFLVIGILVYLAIREASTTDMTYTIIDWVSAGVLMLTNILYIVDLAREKNRGEVSKVVEPEQEQPKEESVPVQETNVEAVSAKVEEKPVVKKTTKKKVATKTKPATASKTTTAKKPETKTAAKKTTVSKATTTQAVPKSTAKAAAKEPSKTATAKTTTKKVAEKKESKAPAKAATTKQAAAKKPTTKQASTTKKPTTKTQTAIAKKSTTTSAKKSATAKKTTTTKKVSKK